MRFDAHELELIEHALRVLARVEHDRDALLLSGRVHVLNATLGGVGLHTRPLDAVITALATS